MTHLKNTYNTQHYCEKPSEYNSIILCHKASSHKQNNAMYDRQNVPESRHILLPQSAPPQDSPESLHQKVRLSS